MFHCISGFMILKKIYWLALLAIACNNSDDPQKPVIPVEVDEPQQYGVPFAAVSDPKKVVLYEVNIRSFSESGNFQGVIDKLDHIKSLGVNTIWLMPIHPVGQVKSAGGLGSPYAVRDYLAVNSEFGDLAKLRELVEQAHNRNMAVLIDWVANHTSWDNVWMANKSWYTKDASGNIIIPPGTNWQDVAELNYDNHDMRKAMIHAMKYWVMEANLDGFRCDAVDFVPTDFWSQAITELKALPGRKLILLAEGGKAENFTAGFQMNYAWDFYNNLKQVYNENKAATSIFTTHQAEYASIPSGAVKLRYTTNHDLSAWEATPMEVFGSEPGALSSSVITIFTSAAPLIYGSQEVGRVEVLPFFTRDPIAWSENGDMVISYQKLFEIYHSSNAFAEGSVQYFPDNNAAIFKRTLDQEEFLIVVNVRSTEQNITLDPDLANTSWTDKLTDSPVTLSTSISLAPYQYHIFRK
jgi:glycosidase